MNKAYSNKALPPGTVLREWRLDEVLGVGGFGIVYKAQGIYFNELVAIKEYFPSAISERDSDDTVVPIDSDSEEVHALGLKKFVEEAKLLWNLSTPSRHPNIVSVRSLFEIHGTAYIVMDFEDGVSLSRMLKQGRRFNERSLWNILRPIAEGLDRAHRVGVLHRDIKPPNILINEDNRPVLIDFGSARFEAAEATSTKVTFHTPPYAAIEQYVKTYPQGPWTDVYALGVVMYECVTGEKPAEVLERLHAGLGKPLAEGKWPGYSKRFLAAIDTAMTVKPEERPQSIQAWLASFGKKVGDAVDSDDGDDEATRFYAQQVEAEEIVPVPPTPVLDPKIPVETGVPRDRKDAKFKRAGEETGTSKKVASEEEALATSVPSKRASAAESPKAAASLGENKAQVGEAAAPPGAKPRARRPSTALMAGAAVAVLALAGGGALMLSKGNPSNTVASQAEPQVDFNIGDDTQNTSAVAASADENAVAGDTQNAAAPEETAEQAKALETLRAEQAKSAAAEAQLAQIKKAAAKAAAAQSSTAVPGATPRKGDRKASASVAETNTVGSEGLGVSPAKLAQFNSIVDDGRSMAKEAMRSSNRENVQLAKNYDKYLKTLKDSMRGIDSDREAEKLIKQASQTRAYIQFLVRQQ